MSQNKNNVLKKKKLSHLGPRKKKKKRKKRKRQLGKLLPSKK